MRLLIESIGFAVSRRANTLQALQSSKPVQFRMVDSLDEKPISKLRKGEPLLPEVRKSARARS